MERRTDNSKMYKYGNGNKTRWAWECFGVQFLLHKPEQHSCWEAGRSHSVFLSFLAVNELFSFVPTMVSHIRGHLQTAHQNLEIVQSDQKEQFMDE